MSVVISDETLQAARMSASELKQEIAIVLFQKNGSHEMLGDLITRYLQPEGFHCSDAQNTK